PRLNRAEERLLLCGQLMAVAAENDRTHGTWTSPLNARWRPLPGADESLRSGDNTGLAVCLQLIANVLGCGFIRETRDLETVPGAFAPDLRPLKLGRVLAENRDIRALDAAPRRCRQHVGRERAELDRDRAT